MYLDGVIRNGERGKGEKKRGDEMKNSFKI